MDAMTEHETTALARIGQLGVLPVVELPDADAAPALAEALMAGGMDAAEITLRTAAGLDTIRSLRRRYPDMLVGAGTVRTREDAERVIDAGARFVVSPGTNLEVIEVARAAGTPVLAGACTPTEVDAAVRAGVDAVKFFPAQAMGGIPVLRAFAGPFGDVSFVPTGGISPANLAEYLSLPNVIACGGTWMVAPRLIVEERFDLIEELTRAALAIAAEARDA
jgi:2-dehydro-3-deoxyphosphogluconate aldolase/(4S)-4-hydroxy-2-oxoglutarate aldolase